jgi:hypothetical protein
VGEEDKNNRGSFDCAQEHKALCVYVRWSA